MPIVAQMHGIVARIERVSQMNGNMVAQMASIGCPNDGIGCTDLWQWLPRSLLMVAMLYCYCCLDNGNGCQEDKL